MFTGDSGYFRALWPPTICGTPDGVIRGKAALRDYWSEGLRRIPDLRFDVLGVYVGLSTLVINYRSQKGALVNEVLTFDGHLVIQGHGTYLSNDTNPAGATSR